MNQRTLPILAYPLSLSTDGSLEEALYNEGVFVSLLGLGRQLPAAHDQNVVDADSVAACQRHSLQVLESHSKMLVPCES
jgi:hypothetical protein